MISSGQGSSSHLVRCLGVAWDAARLESPARWLQENVIHVRRNAGLDVGFARMPQLTEAFGRISDSFHVKVGSGS